MKPNATIKEWSVERNRLVGVVTEHETRKELIGVRVVTSEIVSLTSSTCETNNTVYKLIGD